MHSLHQHTRDGVVMTHEITHSARPTHVRNDTVKIINQYEVKHKVGKGQHGEVYLAEDSTKAYIQVVRPPVPAPFSLYPRPLHAVFLARPLRVGRQVRPAQEQE